MQRYHSSVTFPAMPEPGDPTKIQFTRHAKKRCEEMQFHLTSVILLLNDPDLVRPAGKALMALSDQFPEIGAVFNVHEDTIVVITVVWRTHQVYRRSGTGFIVDSSTPGTPHPDTGGTGASGNETSGTEAL